MENLNVNRINIIWKPPTHQKYQFWREGGMSLTASGHLPGRHSKGTRENVGFRCLGRAKCCLAR